MRKKSNILELIVVGLLAGGYAIYQQIVTDKHINDTIDEKLNEALEKKKKEEA